MIESAFKLFTALSFVSVFLVTSCSDNKKDEIENVREDKSIPFDYSMEAPDFAAITDVKAKKEAFFEYIYKYVEKVNLEVLERRVAIEVILEKSPQEINDDDIAFVDEMSEMYLKDHDSSNTLASAKILQQYIRVIPPSLALAQAANESAWGTSRFATDANNYFGQWCFTSGCGLVPKKRNSGQAHEVRKFNSPEGSVRSYIRNLNTHLTYEELREIRHGIHMDGDLANGLQLAEGLAGYSERGEEYVHELQSMIRVNKLVKYDKRYWDKVDKLGL
jgi:Bax protein